MRIVHVSTQRGWHGGEQQACLLIEGLARRGHESLVLARADGKFGPRLRQLGFQVFNLSGHPRSPRAIWHVRRLLNRWRPDVIHLHDPHSLSCAGLAAWGLRIPARIVARRVDFPIRSTWRYRRLADRVIAVSHSVARVCHDSGLSPQQVVVVHDGVDPARVANADRARGRASLGLSNDQLCLLNVAKLTDHKGHTFLLRAMVQVRAQFPNAVLVLAGDGELRAPLEAESRQLGLENAVRFVGYREDVPDLLQAADLFIFPSHLEGLGSSLIDVMFARRPIVATTAGGIPDLLGERSPQDPAVAMLVPPRDPAALANAIASALANPAYLQTLVARAEARALTEFTADQMVDKTLAVYADVLARRAAA